MNVVLYAILFVIVLSAAVAGVSAAPWLPTKPSQRRRLLARLPLKGNETVVDLGCGDGSLLFAVAKKYPNVTAIGCDISLLPLAVGVLRKLLTHSSNVHLRFGNLFTQPLHDVDVVFIFLLSKAYPRLVEKYRAEIRDDTRVIVEAWPLPNIEPSEIIREEGMLTVYVYRGSDFR